MVIRFRNVLLEFSLLVLLLITLFSPQFVTPSLALTRPIKYYGLDRGYPITDANYQTLKDNAVKTIIIYTYIDTRVINATALASLWSNIKTLTAKYNFNYVIWPDQGGDVSGCRWEYPFNEPVNGYYIGRVTSMLDYFASDPRFIGMVSEHEPASAYTTCKTLIEDMAAIKTQLKDYMNAKGRTDWKVWNYIDNIKTNLAQIPGYKPADIARVMDVAVTWQHCFGGAEGSCTQAKQKILDDHLH